MIKTIYDDSESLFCRVCGLDYRVDPTEPGTYVCPCGRKNKNIDAAISRLGVFMNPRANSILVTFSDGVKTLILPQEDDIAILKRFDMMDIPYSKKELSPEESYQWLKDNPQEDS